MLTLVRSPAPCIPPESNDLPPAVRALLARVHEAPERCYWIVPTSRRRRALQKSWLAERQQAAVLPRFHTLESFAAAAMEYSARQKPQISGPERLLRVARAWQEESKRTAGPGLVRQLDRFIGDWLACRVELPDKSKSLYDKLIARYVAALEKHGRHDRQTSLAVLIQELDDAESWPSRALAKKVGQFVFDGFHRLDRLELDLLAALSGRSDVLLWLVAGQAPDIARTADTAIRRLRETVYEIEIIDFDPATIGRFSSLGRRLFYAPETAKTDILPKLETRDTLGEVEAVARDIKAKFLTAKKDGSPFRLADVAVIIPGPGYDALVREVFPRAGLEFNLAGRALAVATSRPARLLGSAIELIQGLWRYDLLLNFLNQPVIKRKIAHAHLLDELMERRPRARRLLDYHAWSNGWQRALTVFKEQLDGWQSGRLELPERATKKADFLAGQQKRLDGLTELVQSLEVILRPVTGIEKVVRTRATGSSLGELVDAVVELFDSVEIHKWLEPPANAAEGDIVWVEYEKDQRAYYKLLEILDDLKQIPADCLAPGDQGRPDLLACLELALSGETYQIKTDDDAGIQIFEIREIRGLSFRHVYVLGLASGLFPALPEQGALVSRREQIAPLKQQLEEKEAEVKYLFAQVFESAEESLVLSRPTMEDDREVLPSPFLRVVEQHADLVKLSEPSLVVNHCEAMACLGNALADGQQLKLQELWPDIEPADVSRLETCRDSLFQWKNRSGWPRTIVVDWPELLAHRFGEDFHFSPSQMETYAACPFRYFGRYVLDLKEREPEPGNQDYGQLIHRVFQLFYARLRQEEKLPDTEPLEPLGERNHLDLEKIFQSEWDELAEGLIDPDRSAVFLQSQGVLDLFLETMRTVEARFGNLATEKPLRVRIGQDQNSRSVYLAAKVDRIDACRGEATKGIVLDYKTGKRPRKKEIETKVADGRMLQLPLYAAAIQKEDSGFGVIGAAYLHLNESGQASGVIAPLGDCLPSHWQGGCPGFDPEAALELALEFAHKIRAGDFSLTQFGSDSQHRECTWMCPLRHVCRHPDGYEPPKEY
jgi:RecB family exonuclease